MSKPTESRRWHRGLPRSCYMRSGVKKKAYQTAAQAAAHCHQNKHYLYQCDQGHWHVASYRKEK